MGSAHKTTENQRCLAFLLQWIEWILLKLGFVVGEGAGRHRPEGLGNLEMKDLQISVAMCTYNGAQISRRVARKYRLANGKALRTYRVRRWIGRRDNFSILRRFASSRHISGKTL